MWRVVLAASLVLWLGPGMVAEAKCATCVESVRLDSTDGGSVLRFTVRSMNGQPLPETGTAVVMQFDGQRSKCLNVSLVRTGGEGNVGTYAGPFGFTYRDASVLEGRADIAGSIWEFSVPVDGRPGTFGLTSYSSIGTAAATIVTPQPVRITPHPATVDPRTAAATTAAEPAARAGSQQSAPTLFDGIAANSMTWLGLIVVVVAIVSAYLDRKRSLARASAG